MPSEYANTPIGQALQKYADEMKVYNAQQKQRQWYQPLRPDVSGLTNEQMQRNLENSSALNMNPSADWYTQWSYNNPQQTNTPTVDYTASQHPEWTGQPWGW